MVLLLILALHFWILLGLISVMDHFAHVVFLKLTESTFSLAVKTVIVLELEVLLVVYVIIWIINVKELVVIHIS